MIPTIVEKYSLTPGLGVVAYDPMTALTVGSTVAGGALAASGTLAGGSASKLAGQMQQTAANYSADQLTENAGQAIGASQVKMGNTQQQTRLAMSTSNARAAASGVNAGVGSPAANVGAIAKRGSYMAALDLFNGQSAASGMLNQAQGERYTGTMAAIGGQEAQTAADLSAAGTLAGTAGSATRTYGMMKYPMMYGRMGMS